MTYEGFCIDLLNEISNHLGFKYEIRVSPKNEYGNCNDEGVCNGMVKELVEKVLIITYCGYHCIQEKFCSLFAHILFSPLSPFLSVGEFKTRRIPVSQIISLCQHILFGRIHTCCEVIFQFSLNTIVRGFR